MQTHKFGKRLVSVITAAALTATGTIATLSSLPAKTVNATVENNEVFGSGDFNDGKGLPWHVCENATGKMNFTIADGVYIMELVKVGGTAEGGDSAWDCQFRHRNLTFIEGNKYRLTYSVWASNRGRMYPKIGDMTNDDTEVWHMNGDWLTMPEYTGNETQEEVENNLKKAQKSGTSIQWDQWKGWQDTYIEPNKWQTFAFEFVAHDTVKGTAELTFHLGGAGQYRDGGCFTQDGTIVKFDNMACINMTDTTGVYQPEEAYKETGVEVNQVGYLKGLKKLATVKVKDGDSAVKTWELKDSAGQTVASGETGQYASASDNSAESGEATQVIDFSDYQEEGTGYTLVCDGKTSLPFNIGASQYSSMTKDALNYFYLNRSGVKIDAQYVSNKGENKSESDLARGAGHPKDVAYIQSDWTNIYTSEDEVQKSNGSIDVTGGWYDAGDFGKYVVNGGVSVWTLNNLYETGKYLENKNGTTNKWNAKNQDLMYIPETASNNYPDILNETKVETDFFFKMIEKDTNLVYHKIHDYKWTGLAVKPDDSEKYLTRIVKPSTYAATLNLAATFAQASRLWEPYDSSYASKLLDQAKTSYAAAKAEYAKHGNKFTSFDADVHFAPFFSEDGGGKGGGAYGDDYVDDDFYWAAAELYTTTGDDTYKTDAESYKDANKIATSLTGGENKGTFSSWTWGTTAALGSISMALNTNGKVDDSIVKECQTALTSAADTYRNQEQSSQWGTPYKGVSYEIDQWTFDSSTNTSSTKKTTLQDGYEWGSNSMVANNAIVMALAYDVSGDTSYVSGVQSAADYLLGRNPMEQSYVTDYGTHCTRYPHHRFWSHFLSADLPYAPGGVLSGGPNSQMQDPMIGGMGYKPGSRAPMYCYYDQLEAWSVNECTINWNSPLAYIASFLSDNADVVDTDAAYKLNINKDGADVTSIKVGEKATASLVDKDGKAVSGATYSSTDESIVTVDANGNITAVKAGKAVITGTSNGASASKTITITDDTVTTTGAITTTTAKSTTTTGKITTTGKSTTTTVATGDTLPSDIKVTLWGDANGDGEVTISDAVLMQRFFAGSGSMTDQGKVNTNLYQPANDTYDITDAEYELKYLVNKFTSSVLPFKTPFVEK